jgi:hypothetical protein
MGRGGVPGALVVGRTGGYWVEGSAQKTHGSARRFLLPSPALGEGPATIPAAPVKRLITHRSYHLFQGAFASGWRSPVFASSTSLFANACLASSSKVPI